MQACVEERSGDDLRSEITPDSKVRIAASTFSIFAFEALRKELEQVEGMDFIFTSPSFVTTRVTDKLRKERREFFIPSVVSTTTHTETVSAGSQAKYDLLGETTAKIQLTRRTAAAILSGVTPLSFAQYRQNPEQFITEAARLINEQKATVIVVHLAYDSLADRFDSAIFTENQTRQDLTNAGGKLNKHIYDYAVTDSQVERDFVTELDTSNEVAVYAKLPRGFFIPTPVGNYNPDWAIAFTEGSVKHIYFVAETKGSLSTLQLKGAENAKIECARKFFASLNEKNGQSVTYDVVTDYNELMQLVAG